MQELNTQEVEQVSGGIFPVIIGAGLLAAEVSGSAAAGIVAVELAAIAIYYRSMY